VDPVGRGHHVVGDVQQVQIVARLVLQPEWRERYQSINKEEQVDLVQGGGHHMIRDVQQVHILPCLVLQPECREGINQSMKGRWI
jgi:hypothetical protein